MTKPRTPLFALSSAPHFLPAAWRLRCTMVGAAITLAACSSTPLPPWPAASTAVTPQAPATPSAPAVSTAPVARVTPIAPPTQLQALPYSEAVAALYPDPAAHYTTPGLEAGRTSFTTNAELEALLRQWSEQTLGSTPRLGLVASDQAQSGTPLLAMVATKAAAINPVALDDSGRPTVLIVAGQQGNAPVPTEATLALLQELQGDGLLVPALDKINLVVVPRANPDGFAQQRATTADGTDLRHDHLLLATPEARFLAKLVRDYRPAVVLDAGEFSAIEPTLQRFGGLRAEDVGLQYAVTPNAHEFVTKAARTWLHDGMLHALTQSQQRVDWVFDAVGSDASAGFAMDTVHPTTLANTAALKHASGLLANSRGQDLARTHVQRRVHSHVTAMTAVLQTAANRARELREIQSFVARDVAAQACQKSITVQAQPQMEQRAVSLLHPQTGQLQPHTAAWSSSLELVNARTRSNACGYWLSASAVQAVERLRLLGVNVQRVAEAAPLAANTYVAAAEAAGPSTAPTSSAQRAHAVTLQHSVIDTQPGSFYVTLNQPLARVAVAALEPDTPYSYYRQGVLTQLSDVARVNGPNNLVFEDE